MASRTKQCETSDVEGGILTEMSDNSFPAHYVLEINSFSMLSTINMDKVESNEFEAGGYKWKLILYPNGDKNTTDDGDHVSLHVSLANNTNLKVGEQIYATIRFSVFDQVHSKYLTKQGRAELFNRMKPNWGISKFMPLKLFINPSSGYLVDDKCMFGVGIFVIKSCGLGDSLTLKKSPLTNTHEWEITQFSLLSSDDTCSEIFRVGSKEWRIQLYPDGYGGYSMGHLSLYILFPRYKDLATGCKVYSSYTLRLKGEDGVVHMEKKGSGWFCSSNGRLGWHRYMCLNELEKCIVNDCFTIEADVAVLAEVSKLC